MSTQAQTADSAVRVSVVVDAPAAKAFAVFTEGIDSWWNRDHTIGEAPLARMVLETHAGGRCYGIGTDGSESDWGRVLAYEPPNRVVFSWDISPQWKHEPDPDKTSEVEVTFIPESPTRTRVELEHRNLERHGEGWEGMRGAVGHPGGWPGGLQLYADAVGKA
jgi:uncharacterized protein YndB with AHSA1/START domain